MFEAWPPALPDGAGSAHAETVAKALPLNVVYRSRAIRPLSAPDLRQLTLAAQARNRNESVTGLLLYDTERFFQWLEGPADGLDRIMRSIRNDSRHTDIEILREQRLDARRFASWNMGLAVPGTASPSWPPESIKAPQEVVEHLRERPEDAPGLLARLVPAHPVADANDRFILSELPRLPLDLQAESILDDVIRTTVIPTLVDGHGLARWEAHPAPLHARVQELTDLLIASDPTAAFTLIRELRAREDLLLPLYASLIEPAARSLGDLWSEDACSEFDVTLGLCRLQTAVRQLSTSSAHAHSKRPRTPAVLIAPEPGELHRLGAALDSEVLWHAGWAPSCAYPASDEALQALVAGSWFDALDLSLSSAFRREHWLPRVTETIALARRASRNPALVVVVGGRVFTEPGNAAARIGADVTSKTALHVDHSILQGMRLSRDARARPN